MKVLWEASLAHPKAGRGLRLRLRLEGSPDLEGLPWESLYDHSRKAFLALDVETPVIRSLAVACQPCSVEAPIPVRVLILTANGQDQQRLDIEREFHAISHALSPLGSRVKIERLDRPTLAELEESLGHCHIFHFIGHGCTGNLLLEARNGRPRTVDVYHLAAIFPGHHSIRLAFLNSCQGAQTSEKDAFSGVAQSFLQKGVPAVVAMRHDIDDDAASLFSARFYQSLARGASVEEAVTRARKAIAPDYGHAWATPALYLRQDVEILPPRRPSWPRVVALVALAMILGAMAKVWIPRFIASWECPSPPGMNMRFVEIPAGSFLMGSGSEPDGPVHEVTLTKPFCLGVDEITQDQWKPVMHSNPSFAEGDDHPVDTVSWQEAHDFLRKLNELDPRGQYRLPTEAQWEYAASDGGSAIYGFGDDVELLPKYGNCTGSRSGGTLPVGSLLATTRWRLHDMHGNVAEWVEDFGAYGTSPVKDPVAPAREDSQHVRRGGSFLNNADHCRAASRSFVAQGKESFDTGFRVVRDPVH